MANIFASPAPKSPFPAILRTVERIAYRLTRRGGRKPRYRGRAAALRPSRLSGRRWRICSGCSVSDSPRARLAGSWPGRGSIRRGPELDSSLSSKIGPAEDSDCFSGPDLDGSRPRLAQPSKRMDACQETPSWPASRLDTAMHLSGPANEPPKRGLFVHHPRAPATYSYRSTIRSTARSRVNFSRNRCRLRSAILVI